MLCFINKKLIQSICSLQLCFSHYIDPPRVRYVKIWLCFCLVTFININILDKNPWLIWGQSWTTKLMQPRFTTFTLDKYQYNHTQKFLMINLTKLLVIYPDVGSQIFVCALKQRASISSFKIFANFHDAKEYCVLQTHVGLDFFPYELSNKCMLLSILV